MDDTIAALFAQIRSLGDAIEVFDREASRTLDIGRSDLRALNALEHGPRTSGDLADALGLTSGSITTLVDRLVGAGYVERRSDPADRRRVEVALTLATYRAFATVYRPCGQAVAEALADSDSEQRSVATRVLERSASAITGAAARLRSTT